MPTLKELKAFLKCAKVHKNYFKRALIRDAIILIHPSTWGYTKKLRSFLDEIASSDNEELGDLLLSIQEEKDLTDEELVGFFMEKKLQYDAKNGIPAASIYIKAYRKLGGIRQFIEDGCLVMEDLENAVLDASV